MLRSGCILFWTLFICHAGIRAQTSTIPEGGIAINGSIYNEPVNSLQGKELVKSIGQKLNLTSVFIKTSKPEGGNICSGFLFYRIYPENSSPGSFNQIECSTVTNLNGGQPGYQNQIWQNNGINVDLIKNLDTGKYFLELYYGVDATNNGNSCNDMATIFLKNAGDPFRARISITSPLNIRFTGFMTSTNNEKVSLRWQIAQVVPELQNFILEKSKNGVAWTVIDTVNISGNDYSYTDFGPYVGINFYRIRANGFGKIDYSIVRRIYVGLVENIITIYPNPVYKNLRFQMTAIIKGQYDVVVYNSNGVRITGTTIQHDGNDNFLTIPLPENLSKGVFWLVLYSKSEFYKRSFVID